MPGFTTPLALLLLPLALLPFILPGQAAVSYSSLSLLPQDPLSSLVDKGLRLVTALCIAALTLGIAGMHRSEEVMERIGEGAQMVILLDSSGSMDRPFATEKRKVAVWGTFQSKGQVARQMLADYAAQRPQDLFAMFAFSRNPIAVLPLTQKQDVIQSAIEAGTFERGLGTTDLASGLMRAFQFFRNRPFTGSRIVMLVSDGAAALTVPAQEQIQYLMERYRVSLYWIYLRAPNTPGLFKEVGDNYVQHTAPEQLVHRFFLETGLPYRAFSAEDPKALQSAIEEVNKLQNLPIRYEDVIPKQDLSHWCYGIALTLLALIILTRAFEITKW